MQKDSTEGKDPNSSRKNATEVFEKENRKYARRGMSIADIQSSGTSIGDWKIVVWSALTDRYHWRNTDRCSDSRNI